MSPAVYQRASAGRELRSDRGAVEPLRAAGTDRPVPLVELGACSAGREVRFFERHNINVLIDFHQFRWSPYFASSFLPAGVVPAARYSAWYYANGRFARNHDGISRPRPRSGRTKLQLAGCVRRVRGDDGGEVCPRPQRARV